MQIDLIFGNDVGDGLRDVRFFKVPCVTLMSSRKVVTSTSEVLASYRMLQENEMCDRLIFGKDGVVDSNELSPPLLILLCQIA